MLLKSITATTALALAWMASVPANAAIQDDIYACRVALEARGDLDIDQHSLRFVSKTGITSNQARTLVLKAIPNGDRPSFLVSCSFNKDEVVALRIDNKVKFAAR